MGVLDELFPLLHKISYPTHYPLGLGSVRRIKKGSRLVLVGGTNLLSSYVDIRPSRNPWSVSYLESLILNKKVILLGCGWHAYLKQPTLGARLFYRSILSRNYVHSVRDSYSEGMLRKAGILNVINTGCPTMWGLSEQHCLSIPTKKSRDVIFTLTDYCRSPKDDLNFINLLKSSYEKIYFWVQGTGDLAYLSSLWGSKIDIDFHVLNPSLASFDHVLKSSESLDYVGTRLHAGIRALQMKRRAIIIGVDNRAIEKRRDFNLEVVDRGDFERLKFLISENFSTNIKLKNENISHWKSQFLIS
jgi:polysaccharide pyruvyl transferase WcaK-like protein